jgi:hypothetical protein
MFFKGLDGWVMSFLSLVPSMSRGVGSFDVGTGEDFADLCKGGFTMLWR